MQGEGANFVSEAQRAMWNVAQLSSPCFWRDAYLPTVPSATVTCPSSDFRRFASSAPAGKAELPANVPPVRPTPQRRALAFAVVQAQIFEVVAQFPDNLQSHNYGHCKQRQRRGCCDIHGPYFPTSASDYLIKILKSKVPSCVLMDNPQRRFGTKWNPRALKWPLAVAAQ